ncbi:hypothetical protein AVEN_98919-1, partial [Araneus ventricosus]
MERDCVSPSGSDSAAEDFVSFEMANKQLGWSSWFAFPK